MKSFFVLILILLSSQISLSQTREENLKFGDDAFADGDYYSASIYYYNILQKESSDVEVAYKYAESCRLFNDYRNAEKWYAFVNKLAKPGKYPQALFWLALMNKSNGKYKEAKKNFTDYYETRKKEDSYFTKKARNEIKDCDYALELISDTLPVIITHLSENVNTPYSEFGALQLGDTALYFSALRPNSTEETEYLLPNFYLSEIYRSKLTIAGWAAGKEIQNKANNRVSNNANNAFSADHKRMYFTRCTAGKLSEMKCAIYLTELKDGKWMKPVKLNDKINFPGYTSTQPALQTLDNNAGEVLYFVSNRPGGIGKSDIWYSLIKDGNYNDPANLGSIVNTPGDEISPYYYNDKKTLYFSSDWHSGLGGYDIFKSTGSFNEWTKPENMGYPINTSFNDMYFTINENDTDGYFTSNRPGSFFIKGETCCNDIWSYEWTKAKTKTKKKDTVALIKDTVNYEKSIKDLLPLTLYFHNDIPNPASVDTVTKFNYKTTLADYIQMKELYEKEYAKGLKGAERSKAINDIDEFFDNYVASGFSKLEQFSEWLLKELQKGKDVRITVKGYCSPLQTTEYNKKLAKRRISSLINYFRAYEYGVFNMYLDAVSGGAKLVIHEDPVGKTQANPLVSDNPNDKRNSIYSRAAALERKIQIIMYQSKDTSLTFSKYPVITFSNESHDFNKITEGEKKSYSFIFQNSGDADLVIAGVETSCGCITSGFPIAPIPPGGKGNINIVFDSKDEKGHKFETITVYSNTLKSKKEIFVKAEIVAPLKQQQKPQNKKK